jgi:hypothetical protein
MDTPVLDSIALRLHAAWPHTSRRAPATIQAGYPPGCTLPVDFAH